MLEYISKLTRTKKQKKKLTNCSGIRSKRKCSVPLAGHTNKSLSTVRKRRRRETKGNITKNIVNLFILCSAWLLHLSYFSMDVCIFRELWEHNPPKRRDFICYSWKHHTYSEYFRNNWSLCPSLCYFFSIVS